MGVAHGVAKVKTAMTSSILVGMGKIRGLSTSTQRMNVDGVVACYIHRPNMEVMKV